MRPYSTDCNIFFNVFTLSKAPELAPRRHSTAKKSETVCGRRPSLSPSNGVPPSARPINYCYRGLTTLHWGKKGSCNSSTLIRAYGINAICNFCCYSSLFFFHVIRNRVSFRLFTLSLYQSWTSSTLHPFSLSLFRLSFGYRLPLSTSLSFLFIRHVHTTSALYSFLTF